MIHTQISPPRFSIIHDIIENLGGEIFDSFACNCQNLSSKIPI